MDQRVKGVCERVVGEYSGCDSILVFGSALSDGWTEASDVDIMVIGGSLREGRVTKEIDGVVVELFMDNMDNLRKDVELERGRLRNRNLSTMIASSVVLKSDSPEELGRLRKLAEEMLGTAADYDDEDVGMWRYSIGDYLSKAKRSAGDRVSEYFYAGLVIQNALELVVATSGRYIPRPGDVAVLLGEIDPTFLALFEGYLSSRDFLDLERLAEYVLGNYGDGGGGGD